MKYYSSYKALVIGVGRYDDPQYDLNYARSDAEAIAELLGNEFGFDQIWTLYDSDATRQNILRFFEKDLMKCDEDDGLLIFFAGHGITVASAIGDDRGFLVPHDGEPKQPYTNLSLTHIRDDYLLMIPAKHVFMVVDACYGGMALRDVATVKQSQTIDDGVLAELTRCDHKVRQVLAAGSKDQRVLDGGLFGHSIFTGRLIEALREADPYITADRVGVNVREQVARDAMDRKHHQTPQFGFLAGGDGSFVFRREVTDFVAPSASSDIRKSVTSEPSQRQFNALLATYAISDQQAVEMLDKWSFTKAEYLSPICGHAELERVENQWAIRRVLSILTEERSLKYEIVPYLPNVHQNTQPYSEDIWSIPFRPPESFVKKEYSYCAPAPSQVRSCEECNGTGEWKCTVCRGTEQIMCMHCDGTGEEPRILAAQGIRKCEYCHGNKKLPCTKCKGIAFHPCNQCGATGKVAMFPVVHVTFDVKRRIGHFTDHGVETDLEGISGILIEQTTANGKDLPAIPEDIPTPVRQRLEAASSMAMHETSGRICRTGMSFHFVPFAICHLRYKTRLFTIIITAVKNRVRKPLWAPPNRRRSWGLGLGIPLIIIFIIAVLVCSSMTYRGELSSSIGSMLTVGSSLGVLVSVGSFIWALKSKAKPRK